MPLKASKKQKIAKTNKNNEKTAIDELQQKYESIDASSINKFGDLPLSQKTLKGLGECGYSKPTEIQRETIRLSLTGKDILGAAKTGSGKTLAFIIPILERLFCKQWTNLDGLGALVITPTRELAYQIFETLRHVGEHHEFSAGLIIGGKDLKFERNRMDQCNIIICTPGRLLQHMDENPLFDCVNLQILVLDEADRCLDMGFKETMNAIVANLPANRQTLLFSATQTKSVKDLARLSLKDPRYVSVHENSKFSTPEGLQQNYIICELKDKISIIWSFIKNHLKQKIIIFFATCKETKYYYEIFCKLRPGSSLLPLYGTLHQLRRMDIYETFCRKNSAILFATDIAARGLDFPEVHWVVQADCPEDSATYIHRVGRTARYHKNGESLLLLLPSEMEMISELQQRKIPIEKIEINSIRLMNPIQKMMAFLAKNPELKETAKRAFIHYFKSVFLMKNKKIFNVEALDPVTFAKSLGLEVPPRIRFLQRHLKKNSNTIIPTNRNKIYFNDDESTGEKSSDDGKTPANKSLFANYSDSEDDEDNVLELKRKDHDIDLPTENELQFNEISKNKNKKPITKAALAKKLINKKIVPNKKIIFDDEGCAKTVGVTDKKSELAQQYENEEQSGIDIEKAKVVLKEEDKFDKQLFREKIKAKHKEEKKKLKAKKAKENNKEDQFSEDEPDLSWLPDPDRIYGEKSEQDLEQMEIELKNEQVTCTTIKKDKKRKIKSDVVEKLPKKLKKISDTLNVSEAEELAMLLLKNK